MFKVQGSRFQRRAMLIAALLAFWLAVPLSPTLGYATVNEVTAANRYTGNGSTTAFTYGFKIFTTADIEVLLDGVVQTLTTHYTVSGAGASGGGTVTFVTAPASGKAVTLLRKQKIEQQSDYVPNETFSATAERIEKDLDKNAMVDQMQTEQLARSLRVNKQSGQVNTEISPTSCGDKAVVWNATATGFTCSTISASGTLSNPVTPEQGGTGGANTTGYTKAALGAAGTAGRIRRVTDDIGGLWMDSGVAAPGWISLNHDQVYVLDPAIGAKCDGTTDDSTAFATAVSRLPANGGTIILPAGTCLVKNGTINKSGVILQGQGRGYISENDGATILRAPNSVTASDDVIRVSGTAVKGVVIRDLEINPNSPNATQANAALAVIGTGVRIYNVSLQGGLNYAFDNKVAAVDADSTDSGGIFDSEINGKMRIASSSFRADRLYMNGSGGATAIKIEGPAAGTGATGISVTNSTIESFGTPVIDIGNTATGKVRNVRLSSVKFATVTGTGNVINAGDSTNGIDGFTADELTFSGDNNQARAIVVTKGAAVSIKTAVGISTFTGGAPILLTSPLGSHDISSNKDMDVEHDGYRSIDFYSMGSTPGATFQGTVIRRGIVLTTTDATQTATFGVTLTQSQGLLMKARSIGLYGSAGTTAIESYEIIGSFRRSAMLGTVTTLHSQEDDAGADAGMDFNAGIARVLLTGKAATTINWATDVEYMIR